MKIAKTIPSFLRSDKFAVCYLSALPTTLKLNSEIKSESVYGKKVFDFKDQRVTAKQLILGAFLIAIMM